jgi:cellulose synthase/poly-beta-1,6-N-acetylglucosamine synthase-like glycosyltransferase
VELLRTWLFYAALLINARAVFKLLIDWKGMLTTCRFVLHAYAALDALPDEAELEADDRAPVFLHLVPAYQEPDIAGTLRALLASRYPHGKLQIVVITKEEEELAPHPAMGISTGEVIRRLRSELPPYQQKMLTLLVMPGPGRKAEQLNWALRPEHLSAVLGEDYPRERVLVGVSDADSIPDPNVFRWIAAQEAAGRAAEAYQGVTLSFANFERLSLRGRVCAIQQSSIFVRVSIARLINEARRIRLFEQVAARLPRLARLLRPAFELCFRRSQICLGHNQFVRLPTLQAMGGFPTVGATEDSTLGYLLGARGVLIRPVPMLELTDLPETPEKILNQNARWYKGVLDDIPVLWRLWRARPTAFNAAQLCRHVGNKVVEWPIAALVYPVVGFLGWHLAHWYTDRPLLFYVSIAMPTASLALSVVVGGLVTQDLLESLRPHLPRNVNIARTTWQAKLVGIFRSQSYWLLATRGAWRVLWSLARCGQFTLAKTDRVTR